LAVFHRDTVFISDTKRLSPDKFYMSSPEIFLPLICIPVKLHYLILLSGCTVHSRLLKCISVLGQGSISKVMWLLWFEYAYFTYLVCQTRMWAGILSSIKL